MRRQKRTRPTCTSTTSCVPGALPCFSRVERADARGRDRPRGRRSPLGRPRRATTARRTCSASSRAFPPSHTCPLSFPLRQGTDAPRDPARAAATPPTRPSPSRARTPRAAPPQRSPADRTLPPRSPSSPKCRRRRCAGRRRPRRLPWRRWRQGCCSPSLAREAPSFLYSTGSFVFQRFRMACLYSQRGARTCRSSLVRSSRPESSREGLLKGRA